MEMMGKVYELEACESTCPKIVRLKISRETLILRRKNIHEDMI